MSWIDTIQKLFISHLRLFNRRKKAQGRQRRLVRREKQLAGFVCRLNKVKHKSRLFFFFLIISSGRVTCAYSHPAAGEKERRRLHIDATAFSFIFLSDGSEGNAGVLGCDATKASTAAAWGHLGGAPQSVSLRPGAVRSVAVRLCLSLLSDRSSAVLNERLLNQRLPFFLSRETGDEARGHDRAYVPEATCPVRPQSVSATQLIDLDALFPQQNAERER